MALAWQDSLVDNPGGYVAVVKRDCPTCALIAPVLSQLRVAGLPITVYSQDDPSFPPGLEVVDDSALEVSWRMGIETVPTLVSPTGERIVGWSRSQWEAFTRVADLGPGLPDYRPGCGSRTLDPQLVDELAVRFGGSALQSRRIELAPLEDDMEAAFERGWSDGLPVIPPTEGRVLRMLGGTSRSPGEVVACIPPDLVDGTVEKIAVNAVLAGCRPEYLPVVLAAVEAACTDEFNMHGLLATTYFSGPLVIVNGPIAGRIGMNSGLNALGQGNRANATIGRALQLVVRNVGGGRPGEVDRATLGNPGKYTFCFAEDEANSPFEPLSVERGHAQGTSTVTLFAAAGVQPVVDQLSRTPESLARTFAACLRVNAHPKLPIAFDAVLVISPEHARVFADAGWDKARLRAELDELLLLSGADLVRGAKGITEGVPESLSEASLPKFRAGGLLIVHAGGKAGLFSAIIGGWASGPTGSVPVTLEVRL